MIVKSVSVIKETFYISRHLEHFSQLHILINVFGAVLRRSLSGTGTDMACGVTEIPVSYKRFPQIRVVLFKFSLISFVSITFS